MVIAHAPRPLPRELAVADLRYLLAADHDLVDGHHVATGAIPGRPTLVARWGWTDWQVRQLLADEDAWRPDGAAAPHQRAASAPPARRQPPASRETGERQEARENRQPPASAPPAGRQSASTRALEKEGRQESQTSSTPPVPPAERGGSRNRDQVISTLAPLVEAVLLRTPVPQLAKVLDSAEAGLTVIVDRVRKRLDESGQMVAGARATDVAAACRAAAQAIRPRLPALLQAWEDEQARWADDGPNDPEDAVEEADGADDEAVQATPPEPVVVDPVVDEVEAIIRSDRRLARTYLTREDVVRRLRPARAGAVLELDHPGSPSATTWLCEAAAAAATPIRWRTP